MPWLVEGFAGLTGEGLARVTLATWRPVFERQIGKPVSGITRGNGVSWSIDRGRGGPNIS